MSKPMIDVFLCTGKDCVKAWRKVCDSSPKKFLKEHLKQSGLPYKLNLVETKCMDACKQAANVCFVYGDCADHAREIESADDADRLLIHLRSCVESVSMFHDVLNRASHQ